MRISKIGRTLRIRGIYIKNKQPQKSVRSLSSADLCLRYTGCAQRGFAVAHLENNTITNKNTRINCGFGYSQLLTCFHSERQILLGNNPIMPALPLKTAQWYGCYFRKLHR